MTDTDQAKFYRSREHQELAAAARATHPESRRIHLRLADAYADMAAAELPIEIPAMSILA